MGEILDRAFGGGGLTLITPFIITSTLSILSENTDLYCIVYIVVTVVVIPVIYKL